MEHEIKLALASVQVLRSRLAAVGWICTQPSLREHNQLFDTPAGGFASSEEVLRLRRHGQRLFLTYKGPPQYRDGVKSRREIEVEVSDLEATAEILRALGFEPTVLYEKDREIWTRGRLVACLDRTPMGDFIELEGPDEELARAARELELDPARALHSSYPDLWQRYRAQCPGAELPTHMVFGE